MECLEGATLKQRHRQRPLRSRSAPNALALKSPTLWMPRIPRVSSTAISSPRTSSLRRGAHAKILDFGLAKMGGSPSHGADAPTLTVTGTESRQDPRHTSLHGP